MWYSQAGQDEWVLETVGPSGYFVDVGAYDGVQTSNTYALEQAGWTGVCIEASPAIAAACASNRRCRTVSLAAAGRRGHVRFLGDRIVDTGGIQVACDTLTAILDSVDAPPIIDYMSLDIEGGELDALTGLDFDRYQVRLMTVEHNLYARGADYQAALYELLTAAGYERTHRNVLCIAPEYPMYHMQPYEDWYMNSALR